MPASHLAAGRAAAAQVVPRDPGGAVSATGRYVLVSIGMSNTTQEFCNDGSTARSCLLPGFMAQAAADAAVDIQVQLAWVKVANPGPQMSLPAAGADAYTLEAQIGQIARALKTRYPNLRQVFLSSRIYAGYANTTLNPEPYAYESGFGVKWAIESQIAQMGGGSAGRAGNLRYDTGVAAWMGWGPYLWAAGATPRADGLAWVPADFAADGTHPATSGRGKVATQLLTFFKTSPVTSCWFLAGQTCPP